MKPIEIEYSRTFNLGKYESEKIGVKVAVDETESPFDALKESKALVLSLHEEGKLIEESKKVAEAAEPKDERPKYDLERITWTKEQGNKGEYEKAVEQNSIDFRALINDLDEHDGRLQRDGFFIWRFSQGNTVGRKPSRR